MKTLTRSVAIVLVFCCFFTNLAPSVSAINTEPTSPPISEEVATIVAAMLISGCIDETNWDEDVQFTSVTQLYDGNDAVTAYLISTASNGNAGYVVVSADFSKPLILEFSDETSSPAFSDTDFVNSFSESDNSYTHYTAPYSQSDTESFDIAIVEAIEETLQNTPAVTSSNGYCENPINYIKANFPGYSYSNYAYKNLDPKYQWITQYVINDYPYLNSCVLHSTACIIKYWRPSWSYSTILSECAQEYKKMWPKSSDYDVPLGSTSKFVQRMFDHYGFTSWKTGSIYQNTWTKGKAQIDAGNPFMLCIASGGNYINHAVTVFAWTTFKLQKGDLLGYKNFFKIQDGYATASRYICTADLYDGLDFLVYFS